MNNKVVLYLALHHGCGQKEKKPSVPHMMGVSTPIPSERKPYMPCPTLWMGGHLYLFKGQHRFLTCSASWL